MNDNNELTVERFKTAYHVDGDTDDSLISGYLSAAKQYVMGAIGSNPDFYEQDSVKSRFNVATLSLAGTYYQYRLAISDLQTSPIDLTVNAIIGQLRGLYASWGE